MLIADAHLDLAWNALTFERDLQLPVHVIRQIEAPMTGKSRAMNTVALPDMRRGRVFLSVATLLARASGRPSPGIEYSSVAQAHAVVKGQMAYYRALERQGVVRVIETAAQLDEHVAEWLTWESTPPPAGEGTGVREMPPLGFVISMEGADPITTPDELAHWRELGLRLLGPAHYGPNRYAGGTGTALGITEGIGPALLREMRRLGIALDCTHLSDEAFWEAVRLYDGPLLASHQNCRAIASLQRQFTDEQIKLVIERGGVLGASFDIVMVRDGWQWAAMNNLTAPNPVMMREVVNHIDHVCELAGNADHVGIGSDLDGGFGREQSPRDLDTIADLQKLAGLLAERGYSHDDIEKIMFRNWVRFLRMVLAQ
ncbi:MAG: peptidase M19 [Chloroflexi bacterium]|uniref:Peptidase M19 n=2 Tax=Candidatus Thermofonsia Clade 3 TaxID=2364209 RepID=A0A2M8QFP1_9CHLR|nr:MAG: peptidase M19 [Candidatus Thermofonsia Clade 3 bacterium]RMG62438.1 MAG: peptidase M19 [Chloroflexota bacterium]